MRVYVTTNLIKFTPEQKNDVGEYKYQNIAVFEIQNLGFEVMNSYPIDRHNLEFILFGFRSNSSVLLRDMLLFHSTTNRFYYIYIGIFLGIFLITLVVIIVVSTKKKVKKGPDLNTSATSSQMIELENREIQEMYEEEDYNSRNFAYKKRKPNRNVIKY